jgi:(p)ppGpp synthase/HD superfamily hydrolase
MTRFEQAFLYASIVHADQRRKGTEIPYISHLMLVAGTVLDHGGDEDEAIAGLLHDAPEDRGGQKRLDDIGRRFGEPVMRIVLGCTDTLVDPKPEVKERRRQYLSHLRAEQDISILLVSAADKLTNARAILRDLRTHGDHVFTRFNAGRAGTLDYYRELAGIFSDKDSLFAQKDQGALVREFRLVVEQLVEEAA